MTYPPPPPDQSGQGGFQYDPYGSQPGSQPPNPGGYSPQQPGYGQPSQPPAAPGYGQPPQLPPAAPGYPPPYGAPMAMGPQNGMGTAALVLGILGIICGGVLAILAIIFGAIGISKANKGLATNKGAATTGLVLGVVGIAWGFIFWLAIYPSMALSAVGSTY